MTRLVKQNICLVYKCPVCRKNKFFKKKGNLALHLKKKHYFCSVPKTQIKCNLCGAIFSTQFSFQCHKMTTMREIKMWFADTSTKKRQCNYLLKIAKQCGINKFKPILEEFKVDKLAVS